MPEYPPGKYVATIEDQGFDRTTNGKEFFGIVIRPTVHYSDGVGGAEEFVNNPFPRTVNFWLTTEQAIAFSKKKLMHATGWDGVNWSSLDPELPNHLSLKGLDIEVINSHKPGTSNPDKTYDNFDVQLPLESKINNDGDIAKRLDRLEGTVPAEPKPEPVPTTTTETPQVPEVGVIIPDEAPF